jgi:hypothetical protein
MENRHLYGIDFSGAQDAGRRIWVAQGALDAGVLRVITCRRAADLPGSGPRREQALAALRTLIAEAGEAAFGLDFPFGLPRSLVAEGRWVDFLRAFPAAHADPDTFRRACQEAADGRDLKRVSDVESRAPFSPYNLRLYRQTFYGLRDLLHPLVRAGRAVALPMQPPRPGRPWLLEACPASLLKREDLYIPYKGRETHHRAARARILAALEENGALAVPDPQIRRALLETPGGDALDSVLATLIVARALRHPAFPTVEEDGAYAVEGYIYT